MVPHTNSGLGRVHQCQYRQYPLVPHPFRLPFRKLQSQGIVRLGHLVILILFQYHPIVRCHLYKKTRLSTPILVGIGGEALLRSVHHWQYRAQSKSCVQYPAAPPVSMARRPSAENPRPLPLPTSAALSSASQSEHLNSHLRSDSHTFSGSVLYEEYANAHSRSGVCRQQCQFFTASAWAALTHCRVAPTAHPHKHPTSTCTASAVGPCSLYTPGLGLYFRCVTCKQYRRT